MTDQTEIEKEKEALAEKCKSMAAIIEELSSSTGEAPSIDVGKIIEPKLKELDERLEAQTESFKERLESIESKIEKRSKIRKDIVDSISEIKGKIGKFGNLEEQMKALDKISILEEQITKLLESKPASEEEKQEKFTEFKEKFEELGKKMSDLEEKLILIQKRQSKFYEIAASKQLKKLKKILKKMTPTQTPDTKKVEDEIKKSFNLSESLSQQQEKTEFNPYSYDQREISSNIREKITKFLGRKKEEKKEPMDEMSKEYLLFKLAKLETDIETRDLMMKNMLKKMSKILKD